MLADIEDFYDVRELICKSLLVMNLHPSIKLRTTLIRLWIINLVCFVIAKYEAEYEIASGQAQHRCYEKTDVECHDDEHKDVGVNQA